MAKIIEFQHRGITVKIRKLITTKGETDYTEFQIQDYTSGRRVRHSRATLKEAQAKAKEICEALATGKREVLEWSEQQRASIRQALKLVEPIGVTLDRAAAIVADAVKLVDADEILAACRHWRDSGPGKRLMPKKVSEALDEFRERREARISERRAKTERAYLRPFESKFSDRLVHEITSAEIGDWAAAMKWSRRTRNDALSAVSLFFADAVQRSWARRNPANAEAVKRDKLRASDVSILTPEQCRIVMSSIDADLKPGMAIWCFGGARLAEIARLTWDQVDAGLASGSIYLRGDQTKTGQARSLPLTENLRAWLMEYRKSSGTLLPQQWTTLVGQSTLSKHVRRKVGFWCGNGPRHSFGTYHLKLHGDPSLTVRIMGTSLDKLQRHYASRSESVTKEGAADWFDILPGTAAQIIRPKFAEA
jgi:integrase